MWVNMGGEYAFNCISAYGFTELNERERERERALFGEVVPDIMGMKEE